MVISTDAMVEGVHFLIDENPTLIAKRLLRTSLSDLAAKAARPFGYFLTTAWPPSRNWAYRQAFARGLAEDGDEFGLSLLGGDTVATEGPLTVSATVLGWSPSGATIPRSGARDGDIAIVCGVIGDGWLGLQAARGEIADPGGRLAMHYRAPKPLLHLREALTTHARAAADVSDGLLADALHVAEASGLGLALALESLPLSLGAADWCANQGSELRARLDLAKGGDDYAIICAVPPASEAAFRQAVAALGTPAAAVGLFESAPGIRVTLRGGPVRTAELGWRH
jgi:thiamine-monophosphate kinase